MDENILTRDSFKRRMHLWKFWNEIQFDFNFIENNLQNFLTIECAINPINSAIKEQTRKKKKTKKTTDSQCII